MQIKSTFWITTLVLLAVLASCKTGKVGGTADCPKKSTDEMVELLNEKSKTKFDFFYSKISITIKDSKSSTSFKTSMKMKPDSAFAGVLKVAGIIGATYLGDKDTVTFTNKLKKCYFQQDYTALTDRFGMELNYNLMEEMLLGKPFGLNTIEELFPLKDAHYYVLSSHDKKAIKRLEAGSLEEDEVNDFFIRYKVDCGTLLLSQIMINAPSLLSSVQIDYTKRQEVEGIDLPEETSIKIVTPEDSTFISLKYGTITLNKSRKIKIKIPDTYNECK